MIEIKALAQEKQSIAGWKNLHFSLSFSLMLSCH